MVEWILANIGTIAVGLGLIFLLCGIVSYMIKNKKKGKSSCGCSCGSCPMNDSCHDKE